MNPMFKKAGLAVALGATVLVTAAPADAQRYRGYRNRDNGGAAVAAGIAGLAIGAAIASSSRDRYYDRGYRGYRGGYGYYDGPRYRGYYDGPRFRGGYRDGYRAYGYRGGRGYCATRRVWDPYIGRSVRVRYCR